MKESPHLSIWKCRPPTGPKKWTPQSSWGERIPCNWWWFIRPKSFLYNINCFLFIYYFYQYFQVLCIFIYNESLPMKSYLSNGHNTKKFLYWQNVHIWRLIKDNCKRSLQFVVVPAKHSSEAKLKFLQITTLKYKLYMFF